MAERHRVVIIGGGFGGLNAAHGLGDERFDVTLLDRTNHHLFQPLLYQVAAGIMPPGLIAPALRSTVRKQRNVRTLLADVYDIDVAAKTVHAHGPDQRPLSLPYDTLIVAGGATHSYFGNDHFAEFAPGMKTIEDSRYLRDGILAKFEMAEMTTDPVERADWLTFVVVGAGPTGVELVGQIAELAHTVLPRDYRSVNTTDARIILLEGAPAVLPPFDPKLQRYTQKVLERMGVEIRLNTLATDMDHYSVTVKGPEGVETIRTRTRIWAAGVQASPLARMLAEKTGLQVDRAGRIPVEPDCSLAGHPEIFAVGDMVSLNNLPGVAQPAIQEGKYVAKLLTARLAGDEKIEPFKYFDKGSMATIGYRAAVAESFGMKFTGFTAYLMWMFIHMLYLVGWGNRLGTIYTWLRALVFTKNRGHRIITFERAGRRLEDDVDQRGRPSPFLPPKMPADALPQAATADSLPQQKEGSRPTA